MSLKNIKYKKNYESNTVDSNPLIDFYIPVLKTSIQYDRIASYYSSSSLVAIANGISGFLKNGGKIRLIINVVLDKKDYDAINDGLDNPLEILESKIVKDINNIKVDIYENRWKVLSWMIAENKLLIKVGVVQKNIEHSKLAIFHDQYGNTVSALGSTNESASGWIQQSNLFAAFNNWTPGVKGYVNEHINIFNKMWKGEGSKTKIYDFPQAAKDGLIKICGQERNFDIKKLIDDLEKEEVEKKNIESEDQKSEKRRSLYYYQKKALVKWKQSNFVGLFQMATGSGKTFTAIKGISYLTKHLDKTTGLLTIIVCPYKHLVEQWRDELSIENVEQNAIYGGNPNWKEELKRITQNLELGFTNESVIVTTYNTYSNNIFLDTINGGDYKILLIADEVHNAGALHARVGLSENYFYRLGLSATPARYYDDYGTYFIEQYFDVINKVTFSFSLRDAMDKGILCGYYYYLRKVSLTDIEMSEYESYNQKIAILMNKDDEQSKDKLSRIFIDRSKVLINAEDKYDSLIELLDELEPEGMEHTLIYCSPQQINRVCNILVRRGIIYHKFTMKESIKERKELIRLFKDGKYKVLVAMKCLDEGVDIPIVKRAIIMASSGNSREYIQRRGRVLRTHPLKEYAEVYDFVIIREIDSEVKRIEKKLIQKQFHRIINFANTAMNKNTVINTIFELSKVFKIPVPEELIDG
jgi:superfamily II DNA or RNA helicase